jgi:SAM-dependent methyltransferase
VNSGAESLRSTFDWEINDYFCGTGVANFECMYQPSVAISSSAPYASDRPRDLSTLNDSLAWPARPTSGLFQGILRRWHRERRRRKVGRAYDMAIEVARMIPPGARVLDIGCGNGYIAHHLSAILRADVAGIDLKHTTEASINYQQYNGSRFPISDQSFEAALLCYVLHHTQDLKVVLTELRRVLCNGGLAVVYEDIPETSLDRLVCAIHNRKWRNRTGPCTFQTEDEWRALFRSGGFEVVTERRLSRWRNIAHPVSRRCYLLKVKSGD